MNKRQHTHERELQYYYELAKMEPYIHLDGMTYKYSRFVHAILAEYDPVNYNRFGMTEQLEEIVKQEFVERIKTFSKKQPRKVLINSSK